MTGTDASDELRALRARAYGPGADIHLDADALSRLRELEGVLPEGADAARHSSEDVESLPVQTEPVSASPMSTDVPPSPPSPSRRRLLPILWIASVIGAAVLGAGLTAAFGSTGAPGSIAELRQTTADDAAAPDPGIDPEAQDVKRYDAYEGLYVWSYTVPSAPDRPTDLSCLMYLTQDGSGHGTCTAAGLDAILDLGVGEDSPAQLQEAYPAGTMLRLQLTGDRVLVLLGR